MFIFIEGESVFDLNPGDQDDIEYRNFQITFPLSFDEAISLLASNSKTFHRCITTFTNFFTIGCIELSDAQHRGLERIAMGDNAIELVDQPNVQTRFMEHIQVELLDKNLNLIDAIEKRPISFGIGDFEKGNILIVGDTPGPDANGFNVPFVGSGSGLWLLQKMEQADIDEKNLYWINAYDDFGGHANPEFLNELKPSRIIALGKRALCWCDEHATNHIVESTYHPQYWRRFKNGQEYPLIKMLSQ
jgi:hypothetical protein